MEDQEFINQLAEKLSKLGTVRPLGFHYLHPYKTAPADSIICNGATYSRALYKDFFDYITTQRWVRTEAEWQRIAASENGFCPFYSDGDGSTNFRTPKFAPQQQQIVMRAPEHLPGDSIIIPPESHEWLMCVVVYGVATNVGSADIQNVMSAVNAVQANITKVEDKLVKFAAPDYSSGITIAANTTVTAQENGYIRYYIRLGGTGGKTRYITINTTKLTVYADNYSADRGILPVIKGDTITHDGVDEVVFFPARYAS
jgi:hypothetical protein